MKKLKVGLSILGIVIAVSLIAFMVYSVIDQNNVNPFFLKEGFILFGYIGVILFVSSVLTLAKIKKNKSATKN